MILLHYSMVSLDGKGSFCGVHYHASVCRDLYSHGFVWPELVVGSGHLQLQDDQLTSGAGDPGHAQCCLNDQETSCLGGMLTLSIFLIVSHIV